MEKEPNLAALLMMRKGDRTYERLSRDCGGTPGANRLQQLANGQNTTEFPSPEVIRGLARGLNASVTDVILAAARSLGLSVHVADPEALVVAGAGTLDPDAQNVILAMARELLKRDSKPAAPVTDLFQGRTPNEEELFERYKLHAAYQATEREETPLGE